jgi:hypothetical protein
MSGRPYPNAQANPRATLAVVNAPKRHQDRILIDGSTPGRALTELKIAQAYVRLSCIPDNDQGMSVSVAMVASCEIRMLRGPEPDLDGASLFWLELFDLSAELSLDSGCCQTIEDAVPIFDSFVAQALAMSRSGGEPL